MNLVTLGPGLVGRGQKDSHCPAQNWEEQKDTEKAFRLLLKNVFKALRPVLLRPILRSPDVMKGHFCHFREISGNHPQALTLFLLGGNGKKRVHSYWENILFGMSFFGSWKVKVSCFHQDSFLRMTFIQRNVWEQFRLRRIPYVETRRDICVLTLKSRCQNLTWDQGLVRSPGDPRRSRDISPRVSTRETRWDHPSFFYQK